MRIALVLACAAIFLPALVWGQKLELKLDSLAAKAAQKDEMDLDSNALAQALQAGKLGHKLPGSVTELHVRQYEFAKPDQYSDSELEPVRKQLGAGSGWSRIINVKEKKESTEIYSHIQGDKLGGLLILACEAKEVSVVYILGALTPEQLKDLVSSNIQYLPSN
jgi:hypothetical protein